VVRVLVKDQTGGSRWITAYLGDVTEGGAGISLMTPLETGSRVVIKGNLGEGLTDVQIDADVKWCTRGIGGVFNVGLKLVAKSSDETT
jgi:PilZ domain